MIYNEFFLYDFLIPKIPTICEKPPTIYSILDSIVNYDRDVKIPIKDLAKYGRTTIFNFDYPLTENVSRETFETMILNKYMQRRIGFETITAFRIQLNVKLNEIMPLYNKLFDSLENWDIFNDGEKIERITTDNRNTNSTAESNNILTNTSNTNTSNISDKRNSKMPQNELSQIRNGKYVTEYNYDTDTTNSNDNSNSRGNATSETETIDKNVSQETIKRSPTDKIAIFKEMQENIKNIYTMIFNDLDDLFYGLV